MLVEWTFALWEGLFPIYHYKNKGLSLTVLLNINILLIAALQTSYSFIFEIHKLIGDELEMRKSLIAGLACLSLSVTAAAPFAVLAHPIESSATDNGQTTLRPITPDVAVIA